MTVEAGDTALIGNGTLGIGATTGDGGLAGAGIRCDQRDHRHDPSLHLEHAGGHFECHRGRNRDRRGDRHVDNRYGGGRDRSAAKGTAVGAAISYNLVQNTISAYIDDSIVTTGGDLDVTSKSSPELIAIAAGVAGTGEGVAAGGSITVNSIANDVDSHIDDSTVQTQGSVSVLAIESALMVVVAGAGDQR